ncbi:MAG: thioesterase [Aerococcus sp.]|nr:thioesterase [Aerococcus sp.]
MGKSYTQTYLLNYERVNALNEWQLSAMLNAFVSTAIQQDHILSVASHQQLLWVITQHDIQITRLPHNGETLQVKTTAWGHNAFFCFRSYEVMDEEGVEIIHGETTYMLIDADTRQVARIPDTVIEQYDSRYERRGPRLPRLTKSLPDADQTHAHQVQFIDLDMNGHMSNAIYLDWLMNDLGLEWQQQYLPKHVTIKYEKELLYKDSLTIKTAIRETEAGEVVTDHVIESTSDRNALIQLTWEQRDKQ